jgi:hypothetical protein
MTRGNSLQPPRLATCCWTSSLPFSKMRRCGRSDGSFQTRTFLQLVLEADIWSDSHSVAKLAAETMGLLSVCCRLQRCHLSGLVFHVSWAWLRASTSVRSSRKSYVIQWPWSLAYQTAFLTAFECVIVAVALGGYLAFSGMLNPPNLLRTLTVVIVVLASGNVPMTFTSVILSVKGLGLLGWMLVSTHRQRSPCCSA